MNKHKLNRKDFILSEIDSIELIGDTETIDITVEDTHMFYANDIYSHNSAHGSDVVEGDKAAGSYNKIMIADFIMMLSRKRQDKVAGTGRVHIQKNRYGSDGMVYPAKINTNCGDIIIENREMGDEEFTLDTPQSGFGSSNSAFKSQKVFSEDERQHLTQKFFELSK